MTLEHCPSCSHEISTEASSCPHCGHPLEAGWAEAQSEARRKKQEKQKAASEKRLAWTILGVALIGGWLAFSSQFRDDTAVACGTEVEAVSYAQILIKRRLKNPESAEFSYANTRRAMLDCGRWQVASYVDATNTFGATVRTNFSAIVRRVGKNRWVLEDLKM